MQNQTEKEPLPQFGSMVIEDVQDEGDPDDEEFEDGVLFYVNKSGFPVDMNTWERMWDHVARLHPDSYNMVYKIRRNKSLPEVSIPQPPTNFPMNAGVHEKLESLQKYMSELQYNHTGTQFFQVRKNRPITGLMDIAKDMIRESLPIKCLEAVILGIYLTNGMPGLDRFPISFKTSLCGNVHRHVVLGVYSYGKYGAIGLSRRKDLMYKPLKYNSLSRVVLDFAKAYSKYFHEVKKVKIGLPVPHDSHSYEQICWKYLSLNLSKLSEAEICKELDKHCREMKGQTRASVDMSHAGHSSNISKKLASVLAGKIESKPSSTKSRKGHKSSSGSSGRRHSRGKLKAEKAQIMQILPIDPDDLDINKDNEEDKTTVE